MTDYTVVDLTMTYHNEMPGFRSEPAKTIDKEGWNASTLTIYSHAGTHMDAPLHFGVSDETIDQLNPQKCIGKAWVIRLTNLPNKYLIEIEDLGEYVEKIEANDSILLQTDWSLKVGTPDYRNELPRISESLAKWLVEKKVNMLGVEPPSIADVNNMAEVTLIHQILLSGKITIIEGLCNLDKIKNDVCTLIALPIKFKNGDGAPARVIALETIF
ncbi:MAG: cyclase family protein [Pseudarcicella sp.]|jgi:kynurenine formamidase|nr:cyclase family protein [Pseudarcicella sp.]